ncbi:hypothetical protein DMC30DRAFT_445647 [Rhodotorula diobovata]|uniref:Ser-Thr-rich glycosyl-phosphatidyl-inositol-anchored membrane family-domain-containing protein n=1 Tax=Rhodotorula diobovata TaxID=5288 RepID=A0A5C5G256_9BASI|nr:hypothetical protein DMC30DRAFT_445647 [Rhodotorula diobovata]
MKFTTTAFAASALSLASLVSAQAVINTPSQLFTCEPAAITWTGGTAPYFVRVYAGGSTTDLLETLQSSTSSNSYTWNVDIAAGTSVTLGLTDSTGATVYSAEREITEGSSTSCVGQGSSGSASSGAAASATSAASSVESAASSATSSAASRATSAGSSAASRASSGTAAASSGAASPSASASGDSGAATLALSGLAGVAALGAALLA